MVQMQSREVKYLPVSTLHSLWSIPLDIFASYDWDIKGKLTISSFKCDEKKLFLWLKISSEESGIWMQKHIFSTEVQFIFQKTPYFEKLKYWLCEI